MKIIRFAILLAGMLLLLNMLLLMRVSSFTAGFKVQAALSIALILYGLFFKKIAKKLHIVLAFVFALPFLFGLFLGLYGQQNTATHTEDVIIVLGASVHGETVSRPLARRLDRALAVWQENPSAYIVTTGGLGSRAIITEAEAMARYLIQRGVPEDRILIEAYSTSTYENLNFANEIIEAHLGEDFIAVIVSSDSHLYRATRIARSLGIQTTHMGAPTDFSTIPVNYLREMLAVTQFWVFG